MSTYYRGFCESLVFLKGMQWASYEKLVEVSSIYTPKIVAKDDCDNSSWLDEFIFSIKTIPGYFIK